jgi:hypothetical protein
MVPTRISGARLPRADHLLLYQVFGRLWARRPEAGGSLAGVGDEELDRLKQLGFDAVWVMGAWQLGALGRTIAESLPELHREFDRALPGWSSSDIAGSPYAIARWAVEPSLGGDAGLATLRRRLAERGMGLFLDFVPNHLARDHHWVKERPELFVRDATGAVAAGKDPYFPPWTDTAQLDYRLATTRRVMIEALLDVASRSDGVRCDMSMLLLSEVFEKTWAHCPPAPGLERARGEFWSTAIDAVRARHPRFLFMAEAYWGLEYRLQTLGFDFTYDKVLYDRLLHDRPAAIRAHLGASPDFQRRSVRFLENHDEPRLAALLDPARQKAASAIAFTVPGLRFLHDGQLEGRKIKLPIQLARRADEPVDAELLGFHRALLTFAGSPALRQGSFLPLSPRQAWPGNPSFDQFVAHRWEHPEGSALVIVNQGPDRAQCRLSVDLAGLAGRRVELRDPIAKLRFIRDGDEVVDAERGLYVDLPGFGVHTFHVGTIPQTG